MRRHIEWLDGLKGVAIALIVLGHVVATVQNMAIHQSTRDVFEFMFHSIYSFHVQLFFFIAGLTFSCKDGFGSFCKKKFLRLLVPYYVWGFASAFLFILMGQSVSGEINAISSTTAFSEKTLVGQWWVPLASVMHAGGWPNGRGFCFNGVLWFLPVLFMAEVIFYWMARVARGCHGAKFFLFALSSVLLLYENPLIYGLRMPYGLTWVPKYLPYLALGYWFSCTVVNSEGKDFRCDWWYAVAGVMCAFCLLVFCFPNLAFGDARRYAAEIGIAVIMIFVMVASAQRKVWRRFAFLAPMSLGIMLIHKFPLVAVQLLIGKLHLGLNATWSSLILCATVFFALTLICYYASKVIVYLFPWSLGAKARERFPKKENESLFAN